MEYKIHIITKKEELYNCPLFMIDQFNWGGEYRPKAYGRLAYLPDSGFLLEMTCEETEPVCHYTSHFEPVWTDSALEGFFAFNASSDEYVNFEINSAGAIVASLGSGKSKRMDLPLDTVSKLSCKTYKEHDKWGFHLMIPNELLNRYFGNAFYKEGDTIRMNFFKIAEGEEKKHFASYSPIDYPVPNFHLPEFFATGVFVKDTCDFTTA